jgi:hypothetical protein
LNVIFIELLRGVGKAEGHFIICMLHEGTNNIFGWKDTLTQTIKQTLLYLSNDI